MNFQRIERDLKSARLHIVAANPAEALHRLQSVVDSLGSAALSTSEAEQLRQQFHVLHSLAEAACAGVRQAREDLAAMFAEAQSSLTYDRQGQVARVSSGLSRGMKLI